MIGKLETGQKDFQVSVFAYLFIYKHENFRWKDFLYSILIRYFFFLNKGLILTIF